MSRGPVAVITGASSGIGEAVARRLASVPDARLVLVARREERLRALAASLDVRATWIAVDLVREGAPDQVLNHVAYHHDHVSRRVNNAGAAWRARFGDGGYANVRRTMALNFDAQVRLTEAFLPLLRASAPSSIVNVGSTAARASRAGTGAYSASKAALGAWSDALHLEERAHGVHVGLVMPGFIETEGFPAAELVGRRLTRWMVSSPEAAAEAVVDAGLGGKAERYVPRWYAGPAALRVIAPRLVRKALGGGAAAAMTTRTGADAREP